jgi:ATP-dependent Clp protease adapter protein ClpS
MQSRLYLLNDDIHSFEEVVYVLQRYLGYPSLQGASIAELVHRTGKCEIKSGAFDELELLKEMLVKEGYNIRLDSNYDG